MNYKLEEFQFHDTNGMDNFLGQTVRPTLKEAREATRQQILQQSRRRVRVGSVSQLNGFVRVSEDTLIHKSTQELWALRKNEAGEYHIERLFDDAGGPLKG